MRKTARLREIETWIAWVRLGATAFVFLEVGVFSPDYPSGYEAYAWATAVVFSIGAIALWLLSLAIRNLRKPPL